jgi:hypothetical protein
MVRTRSDFHGHRPFPAARETCKQTSLHRSKGQLLSAGRQRGHDKVPRNLAGALAGITDFMKTFLLMLG